MRILIALTLAFTLILAGCGGGGGGATAGSREPLPEGQKGKWTVLVFMNAANDLYRYSTLNMNQMERVANNPEVRYVVQWKQTQAKFPTSSFDGTRRYLARPDTTETIASRLLNNMGDGVDMGSAAELREFVQWGKATFPADRYLLVIWNHGNGWMRSPLPQDTGRAVSYDDETGNAIQIWQLPGAIQDQNLAAVAFDASLMQMAEVAYELRNTTPFVIGSEESPPGEGYPYADVFRRFQDNPDLSTRELTKGFVDGMLGHEPYKERKITQSVLESSKLQGVATASSNLALALIARPALATQIQAARSASQPYSVTSNRRYFDLINFCDELSSRVSEQGVRDLCAATKSAVLEALVWEGHNTQSAGSRGLAIDLSNATQFAGRRGDYSNLDWAQETAWDEWLEVAP